MKIEIFKYMKIALIEDDWKFATNLKEYFNLKGSEILAHETNYTKFLKLSGLADKKVDVLILDINLENGEIGLDGIPLIKESLPDTEIVILTSHDDSKYIFQALCNGAVGFLTKGMSLDDIYTSVEDVVNGGSAITPSIARKVVSYFKDNVKTNKKLDVLTPREYQIVEGIKDGHSYKMIADKCFISIETVRYHVKNIYKKLHVNSKAEVINIYFNRAM